MRANGPDDAGEREVDAIASERVFFRARLDCGTASFDLRFHMRAQFVELLADRAFQLRCSRFEPTVGNLRKNARFASEPRITELFPRRFVMRGSAIGVEPSTKVSEERGEFLGPRDAEMDERLCRFVFVCRHRV